MSRYTVKGGYDGQFQPGSNNLVLRNKLGITTEDELERIESLALADAKNAVLEWFEDDTVITSKLIFDLHWLWLRNIYEFAGHRRTVNMSKPGVAFCVANYISTQMEVLEKNFLSTLTPCSALSIQEVSDRVARVHAELLLIHPFREGNGRIARWIADLMILQAGFPAPEYDVILGKNADSKREQYYAALRKGYFDQDIADLSLLFQAWIRSEIGDL